MMCNLTIIKRIYNTLKKSGVKGTAKQIISELFPKRISNYEKYFMDLNGKSGLELGGPSKIFRKRGEIPIYPIL